MRPLLFSLLVACGGATTGAAPEGASSATADAAFARFVDDYVEAQSRYSPTHAVENGFHAYDARIEDRSRAATAARVAELHSFLGRLAAIDHGKLGRDAAIDAVAVENDARAELLDLETLRLEEKNPMRYAGLPGGAVDVIMKRDFAPPAERLRSIVARLRGVPALYAAARANVA